MPTPISHRLLMLALAIAASLLCLLSLDPQVSGEVTYIDRDETIVSSLSVWEGDYVITGNLTIPDDKWLILDGNITFNTTAPGQYGLRIGSTGILDIINGSIGGIHTIRLDIKGGLWAYNATIGGLLDEGLPHVDQGYVVWEGGELPDGMLLKDSMIEISNYTGNSIDPSLKLDNTTVLLYNSDYDPSSMEKVNGTCLIERGYYLDLTFHNSPKRDEVTKIITLRPIKDGTLSIYQNDSMIRSLQTKQTGSVGVIGLSTHRYEDGNWTYLGHFTLNFSRENSWWSVWNLTLESSISELLTICPNIQIEDVSIIHATHVSNAIMVNDIVTFNITLKNNVNVWTKGEFEAKLMGRATQIFWTEKKTVMLEPFSTMKLTFYWNASEEGNYALYLLYTDQDEEYTMTSQQNVDVKEPNEEPPTFLGLGYEYWLVILPTMVIVLSVVTAIVREERRLGKYRVEEVFLLDSIGRVIGHSTETEGGLDEDLVGSMLTALQDFVAESFHAAGQETEGEGEAAGTDGEKTEQKLKRLEHGDLMLLIEHGYHCFIVLVITGQDRSEIRKFMKDSLRDIEARFGPVLANWDGDASKLEGAGEIVRELAQVKSSVHWKFDPRAYIAGWKERHGR